MTEVSFENSVSYSGNTGNPTGLSTVGFRTAKFTPAEWESGNYEKFYQSLNDQTKSDVCYNNAWGTIHSTQALTDKNQKESTERLKERLHDVHFWKTELHREIIDVTDEQELMKKQKKRLENALIATECPLHIVTDNLNCRDKRYGTDKVADEVENALLKEIDVINKVQDLLKKTIQQVDSQIEKTYHAKDVLEHDWSDKKESFEYDDRNVKLNNGNVDKQFYPGAANMQELMSDPVSWAQHSSDNISFAERERIASSKLRALIDCIITDTSRDMREAADHVEVEMSRNIDRLINAKNKMEDELRKTCNDIAKMEKVIEDLKTAIAAKDDPLKVAQTRLHNRSFRPNVDLCEDPPQINLINEVNDISNSLDALLHELNSSENSLKDLTDTRMMLEKDIQMKKNTIFIDKEKCFTRRSRYPSAIRLQGYNNI